jgi:hypothetical protein
MDLYWVVRAGYDRSYSKSIQDVSWHVKDMDKVNPDWNAEIGTGSIDLLISLKQN